MIDSTARAPRFDGDSAAPAYVWAPPHKPVAVTLPLGVIAELERAAVESFRSISSRGSEIGGLMFGAVAAGAPVTVKVESFEPVECDYTSGPLYRLSDAELTRLDRVIEQRAASGSRVVGFYRSHTRKGLSLDPSDLALFESRFTEPHHFALLIRPAAAKPSTAGIFIRENGVVHGEASCLEFPFRSTLSDGAKPAGSLYDGAVAGPRSVAAVPATPRPATRAQIVPIASRREVAAELPAPAPLAAAEPVVADPPPPAAPEPEVAPPVVEAKTAATPAAVAPVVPTPEPPKTVEPEPVAAVVKSVPAAVLDGEPVKTGSSKLLWIALGAIASVVLCVGFVLSSGMLHRGKPTIPANQDTSPLALRVDRNAGDIVLTWNRDSDAIRKASRAVLSINDGPQQENVNMDLAQLRNGSIVYTPASADVVFRMEVMGTDQAKTVSESVRVLRTRPSPMPEPGAEQPQSAAAPAPTPASGADAPAAPSEEEKPVALAQASKPFHADSLAQRLRPASPADIPDTPAVGGVPVATPGVNLGSILSTQAPLPAPAPAVPAASAPVSVEQKTAPSGGQIVQAQLIKHRDPEYPRMARETGAGGLVELIATVGADGRVKAVKVVKGHPLLRQAAADAVKGWLYKPTLLNGVPVESQMQVSLNFKAER